MVPAMDSALGRAPPGPRRQRRGLIQTLRQTGSAIGVAVLGSVLAAGYRGRLDTAGLSARRRARRPRVGGRRPGRGRLARRPRAGGLRERAYVHGMDMVLAVCGGTALLAAALVAAFLPNPRPGAGPLPDRDSAAGPGARTADPVAPRAAGARQ